MDRIANIQLKDETNGGFQWYGTSWVVHLVVAVAIIVAVFVWSPSVFSGDTDTARNYVNTIVSSLSTILALCISIILVAIQLTASNYTHRVLDFFVRLPYNASLFTFYLVTIMHSFFLMVRIQDPVDDPLSTQLQQEMSADLILVVICFISLLLYMYAVMQLLKPERIIDLIQRDFHKGMKRRDWQSVLDNVEQICDIAKRAASVSDSVTGIRSVNAMLTIASRLPLPEQEQDGLMEVHQSVVDQWVEMVGVSVKERESGVMYTALQALESQGLAYLDGHAWQAAEAVIRAFRHIVFSHLLPEGQLFYTEGVTHRLYKLAYSAVKEQGRGREFCLRTWAVIRETGQNAFVSRPESARLLMNAFLLVEDIEDTFDLLGDTKSIHRALCIYMEIWKECVVYAGVPDAAKWAEWWSGRRLSQELLRLGESLAILVALHRRQMDIAQTLTYTFRTEINEVRERLSREPMLSALPQLCDGWPWHEILARGLNSSEQVMT